MLAQLPHCSLPTPRGVLGNLPGGDWKEHKPQCLLLRETSTFLGNFTRCQPGYHGERCHGLLLPVEHPPSAYDHTTALAVVAVVLSSLCLVIIAALLMLRCHKRGGYDRNTNCQTAFGFKLLFKGCFSLFCQKLKFQQ
ncbi:hypothetical protein EK904_014650 [Melospiza melodia maxima]|nr:hypothetical protein EK904_014650 [Melospiza melodia maxima]